VSEAPQFDLKKLAVVYLRQSSLGQVRDNVVATEEQYRLREIPERLGFAARSILVVDEDLGVSGQTIAGRNGMLRVIGLLEEGRVSAVVVRDVSRLTRDEFNADIGLIARACFQSGALIVTPEKVYDPSDPSDQLMLGLQGLLAGWDRANLVRRLAYHRKAKQQRGVNINGAVPPGYEKPGDVPRRSPQYGRLRMTVNAEVRERVALVLSKGLELGGVLAVVRFLRESGLSVPQLRFEADDDGTPRRVVQWVEATRDRITRMLKNPTYAGAVVNGRRTREMDRVSGRRRWVTRRSYDHCTVIQDAHPAYITWDEHVQLLALIARNNQAKTYSSGEALLSGLGLLRCGICGSAMVVQYNNPTRRQRGRQVPNTPYVYACTRRSPDGRNVGCQSPAGPHIDRAAAKLIVFALGRLDLDGFREAASERRARNEGERRLRAQHLRASERRAKMLEAAIGDATTAEARTRLVSIFEAALAELEKARVAAVQHVQETVPALGPEMIERLETFRDPAVAWTRFTRDTRKEVLRALSNCVTIYPNFDGYFVVVDWDAGARAAARVTTARRQKLYPVPEEVLALFDGEIANETAAQGRVAARPRRARQDGPGSPRRDAARFLLR
jgi:DNA invertase Pin-like site-specific DNA recombinase